MFTETLRNGSRVALISSNGASGSFTTRLYVNDGTTPTSTIRKAKTLIGARRQALKMTSSENHSEKSKQVETVITVWEP